MDIRGIGSKIIEKFPEITEALSKLTEDKAFQEKLGKAGSIGALFSIGIDLFGVIKKSLTPPEKRAFAALLRIMLESAEKTLQEREFKEYSEISIEQIAQSKEDFINELFDKFIDTTELYSSPPSYLPYHPVIATFREQICGLIRKQHEQKQRYLPEDTIQMFIFEFNKYIIDTVQKEATSDTKELEDLLIRWQVRKTSRRLTDYLKYAHSLQFEIRPIDGKYLKQYYIHNRAIKVDTDTWGNLDNNIEQNYDIFRPWNIEEFLASENEWYKVVAAPFGVGKTSFAKEITSTYAYNYLSNPNSPTNYIPVFVRLKDNLNNVYNQERERILLWSNQEN